jgi:hypothetical protein
MGSVVAGGAAFLAGSKAPGFASVVNGGVGLNDLSVDQAVDATQSLMFATPRTATADCSCQTTPISDNAKRVRTYVAGVLSDLVPFDVVILRIPDV